MNFIFHLFPHPLKMYIFYIKKLQQWHQRCGVVDGFKWRNNNVELNIYEDF